MFKTHALTSVELLELSDANLAEALREQARWVDGCIDERASTLRVASSTRFAAGMFNAVMCLHEPPADPDAWLAEQVAHYAALGRGFSVYARAQRDSAVIAACERAGMARGGDMPAMVCEAPLPAQSAGKGQHMELVHDAEALARLAEVEARSYASLGLPESVTRKVFGAYARMLAPHWAYVLATEQGVPAAGAMLLLAHGIAGIYWVGTTPEARRRGLGAMVTTAVTNLAFERGARAVVLQASPAGEPVYLKLGFRTISRYPWFVQPGPRAS